MDGWKKYWVGRVREDWMDGWKNLVERRGLDNWMDGRNVGKAEV